MHLLYNRRTVALPIIYCVAHAILFGVRAMGSGDNCVGHKQMPCCREIRNGCVKEGDLIPDEIIPFNVDTCLHRNEGAAFNPSKECMISGDMEYCYQRRPQQFLMSHICYYDAANDEAYYETGVIPGTSTIVSQNKHYPVGICGQ